MRATSPSPYHFPLSQMLPALNVDCFITWSTIITNSYIIQKSTKHNNCGTYTAISKFSVVYIHIYKKCTIKFSFFYVFISLIHFIFNN